MALIIKSRRKFWQPQISDGDLFIFDRSESVISESIRIFFINLLLWNLRPQNWSIDFIQMLQNDLVYRIGQTSDIQVWQLYRMSHDENFKNIITEYMNTSKSKCI